MAMMRMHAHTMQYVCMFVHIHMSLCRCEEKDETKVVDTEGAKKEVKDASQGGKECMNVCECFCRIRMRLVVIRERDTEG